MTIMLKILAGGAGLAAMAAAAPAAAQYPGYSYGAPYGYAYGYNQNMTQVLAQRCSAAVQARLANRTSGGIAGILGTVLGANVAPQGRVLGVTQINPRRSTVRVHGVATSGRSMGYGPYGVGAYGGLGYSYQPDLRFRCDVDYNGYIRDIDIDRR